MGTVEEINYEALKELIARVEHAIEHELALEADDLRLLLSAIHTLMTVQSQLEEKDITLYKLRKLLGMITSSEKRKPADSDTEEENKKDKKKKQNQNRKPKPKNKPARTEHHKLDDVKKGDACPECPKGKLLKHEPGTLLRVSGGAPLEAVKHIVEQLKCNLCDYVVRAQLPDEVLNDGDAKQQYGYSARSVMSIHKHFSGIPYYHQGTLNELFGWPVTASSIFDQCEYVANDITPVFHEMKRVAANAYLIYIDDTNNRILDSKPEERPKRNGSGTQMRSGIYTSGLIAMTETGKKIYLYNTSLGHAGEFLDEILRLRDTSLPPPIIMSDALSRNLPTAIVNAIIALCNSHARRLFIDVEKNHPQEVKLILGLYGKIWTHDKESEELGHSHEEHLAYHKEKSLPVMESIKVRCESYLTSTAKEEHGGFGKACKYFLKHYGGLTQFCRVIRTPIDNNRMEEGLKVKIRSRKTSHFYRTQTGADVANVLTSVIATTYRNDINPFHYLNCLQRNSETVKVNPASWLPWVASLFASGKLIPTEN
jgi:hypothetical protein